MLFLIHYAFWFQSCCLLDYLFIVEFRFFGSVLPCTFLFTFCPFSSNFYLSCLASRIPPFGLFLRSNNRNWSKCPLKLGGLLHVLILESIFRDDLHVHILCELFIGNSQYVLGRSCEPAISFRLEKMMESTWFCWFSVTMSFCRFWRAFVGWLDQVDHEKCIDERLDRLQEQVGAKSTRHLHDLIGFAEP